ncbi:MAG TPA: ferritin-like domain-containing protein [Cytophagaceae bacterium]|jgi:hypothetical protein
MIETNPTKETIKEGKSRRSFMKYAGAAAATSALIIAGCKKKDEAPGPTTDQGVDLGSGDTGVLNYAYALEQLEAAFYTTVVADAKFKTTFNASEQTMLMEIKDHEVVHRDFLKAALGKSAIQDLEVNFTTINFGDRMSVLGTAKVFEDLGVSAYNGAGKLLTSADNLLVAGKIVSVEARHAAAIRDTLNPKMDMYENLDAAGMDKHLSPQDVLKAASPYLKTKINASNLPTT